MAERTLRRIDPSSGPLGALAGMLLMLLASWAAVLPLATVDDGPPTLGDPWTQAGVAAFDGAARSPLDLVGTQVTRNTSSWQISSLETPLSWTNTTSSTGGDTHDLDMTMDILGRPWVCAWDETADALRVIAPYGGHSAGVVDSGPGRGEACSIAVDDRLRAHLAYVDTSSNTLRMARDDGNGAWQARAIQDALNVSPVVDIELTPEGHEVILWRAQADASLHLSWFTSTWWKHRTLMSSLRSSLDFDLELAADGTAYVAFADETGDVRLLTWKEGVGSTLERVDRGPGLGEGLDLELLPDGRAIMAYGNGNLDEVRLLEDLAGESLGRIDSDSVALLETGNASDDHGAALLHGVDVNGDGADDVLIGAPGHANDTGAIHVHYGAVDASLTTPDVIVLGPEPGSRFASALAAAGDVDGDGWEDILVGAPSADGAGTARGSVMLLRGSPNGLISTPAWRVNGTYDNGSLGHALATPDVDGDGVRDLAASQPDALLGGFEPVKGQVLLWSTASGIPAQVPTWSKDNIAAGARFGVSLANAGDVNNDQREELAIGVAGTLDDPATGRGRVEVYLGSALGLEASIHQSFIATPQGSMFGASVTGAGDIDDDGYDDLLVGEPDNASGGLLRGQIWLFRGGPAGLGSGSDWSLLGTDDNDRFGAQMTAAGDVDRDGHDDVLVTRFGPGGNGGQVELLRGQANGTLSEPEVIAGGLTGDRLGRVLAAGGDHDGDGLREVLVASTDRDSSSNPGSHVFVYTQRAWAATDLEPSIDLADFKLEVDGLGRPQMLMLESTPQSDVYHAQRQSDVGIIPDEWLFDRIGETSNDARLIGFALTWSGRPMAAIATHGQDDLQMLRPETTRAVHSVADSSGAGRHAALMVNDDDQPIIVHANTSGGLFRTLDSDAGWQLESIGSAGTVNHPMAIHTVPNGTAVVLRDAATSQLEVRLEADGVEWQTYNLTTEGNATSTGFASVVQPNGTLTVATTVNTDEIVLLEWNLSWVQAAAAAVNASNGSNGTNGTTPSFNASGVPLTAVGTFGDSASTFDLHRTANGTLWLASTNSSGEVHLWTDESGGWAEVSVASVGPGASRPAIAGAPEGVTVVSGTAGGTATAIIHAFGSGTVSIPVLAIPALAYSLDVHILDGRLSITQVVSGGDLIMGDGGIDLRALGLTSLAGELTSATGPDGRLWQAVRDADGTLRVILYADDVDRDVAPSPWDATGHSGQWNDDDGDTFGDNPDAPIDDDCTTIAGTSVFGRQGCLDSDSDGWGAGADACAQPGSSWWDRNGCPDQDRDGWSDSDGFTQGTDRYPTDWKQAQDTDGDQVGDNHGPDVTGGDWFPEEVTQYLDDDRDGYGNNQSSGAFQRDGCVSIPGNSTRDRFGCPDTDGDGWSDLNDRFPFTKSQWNDTDMDGYGDNQSEFAEMVDVFLNDSTQWNDTDLDGYGDNWGNESWNVSRANGSLGQWVFNATTPDACPGAAGTSTLDRLGCPDRDGDGWSDVGDALPDNPTQYQDRDGDGFGDDLNGTESDACPDQFGVLDGTNGTGCEREALPGDTDADGVLDTNDLCPGTLSGPVDVNGCSDAQKDDDGDMVSNADDRCPGTPTGETVDAEGCTTTQAEADTDGDGVNDPDDNCPATEAFASVDANGCADTQLDTDGDGVSNAFDQCPATPAGAVVDGLGCRSVTADADGDGVNDSEDAFPADADAFGDFDGDGYVDPDGWINGSRPADARLFEDACDAIAGNSTRDRYGCRDRDGDGWSDPTTGWTAEANGADWAPLDPAQWRDADIDGIGDNSSAPGGDQCPTEFGLIDSSAGVGCPEPIDPGPTDTGGGDDPSEGFLGLETTELAVYGGGGAIGLLLLIIILVLIMGGGGKSKSKGKKPAKRLADMDDDDDVPMRGGGGGPQGGFGGPPQQGGFGGPPQQQGGFGGPPQQGGYGGPPPQQGGGYGGPPPQGGYGGPPQQDPYGGGPAYGMGPQTSGYGMQQEQYGWEDGGGGAPQGLFGPGDAALKEQAVRWTWEELHANAGEHDLLFQLQQTGWSPPQAQAILEEARQWG